MKLTVKRLSLNVVQAGARERALVLLHFWGSSSREWSHVIEGSRAGHSMGDKTAQVLASRRPQGLRGLALVASAPASPMQISQALRDQMRGAYASRDSINWGLDNVLTGGPISENERELVVSDALRLAPAARDGWVEVARFLEPRDRTARRLEVSRVEDARSDRVRQLHGWNAHRLRLRRVLREHFGIDRLHAVGPDIGTSALLFAAAQKPTLFESLVVGSGAASMELTGGGR